MIPVKTQDIVLDECPVMVGRHFMADSDYEKLLRSARTLLDRFMFDGDERRDDVASICMRIDDVLPSTGMAAAAGTVKDTGTLTAAA